MMMMMMMMMMIMIVIIIIIIIIIIINSNRYFEESVLSLKFSKYCFKNKPETEILKKI